MDPSQTMMTERSLGVFSPLDISADAFAKAYELPIGEHVEKNYKGLSYLSWPFAFRYLKEQFPALFVQFEEATVGWPVFGKEGCWLLRPYLTDGMRRTPALMFPIMDNKHNAVKELDARQVSDNIQRASVKCIATFTGLGLRLYSGEDIPKSEEKDIPKLPIQQETPKPAVRVSAKVAPVAKSVAPEEEFNGKEALLSLGRANPFCYSNNSSSMKAVKAALEALGLSKGEDIKDKEMFANVVTVMVTTAAKGREFTGDKDVMTAGLDTLCAICIEGTTDEAIQAIKVWWEGKY